MAVVFFSEHCSFSILSNQARHRFDNQRYFSLLVFEENAKERFLNTFCLRLHSLSYLARSNPASQWRLAARSLAPTDAAADAAGAGRRRQSMYKPEAAKDRRRSTYGAQMAGGGLLPQW